MRQYHEIIIRPLITEKATQARENDVYYFVVNRTANKIEIRHAVETAFGIKNKVLSVRTMNMKGKPKSVGRYRGFRSDWKKAAVKLIKGVRIDDLGDT
jgi:large subunit ribosomal protein L23